jgi:hypothetical protein
MFVKFRTRNSRLLASLIENRRLNGRIKTEHIANLGSCPLEPTVNDRIKFWQQLHERLGRLDNRVDDATKAKVYASIHARIPMVVVDEQQSLRIENAKSEEKFWSILKDLNAHQAEGHSQLAAKAERAAACFKAAAASDADAKASVAKDRAERLVRGENVEGGLGKNSDRDDLIRWLKEDGFTDGDIKQCLHLGFKP